MSNRFNVRNGSVAIVAAMSLAVGISPADAILTRTDYVSGSANYARYENLANQSRFETIGGLNISTPFVGGASASAGCSGTMISANIVLTAAHCMYLNDSTNSRVSVYTPRSFGATSGSLTNGSSVLFGTGSTFGAAYSAQADFVSVFPGYDGTYGSGDLALVRLSNLNSGAAPSTYLPIYAGTDEANIDPAFAVTIGYGSLGNGSIGGTVDNNTGVKLAGLTEVDFTGNANVLSSTFLSPGQIYQRGYPSNFLQAAPAHGDSGGPLILNNAIIGTVGGGPDETPLLFGDGGTGDFYGEKNYWVRTSSYASWIGSESLALNSQPPAIVTGTTSLNPIVVAASSPAPSVSVKTFSFLASSGLVYLDPTSGAVDEFLVSSGPPVDRILLSAGTNNVEFQPWDTTSGQFTTSGPTLTGGSIFNLLNPSARFRLVGLGGSLVTIGFGFAESGLTNFTWTSTTTGGVVGAVPETSTWALMIAGLGMAGAASRRRRRSAAIQVN